MNDPREIWNLDLQFLGKRVLVFDSTDSTNNRAADLAFSRGNNGVAILADSQTAGRGQQGRTWVAQPCSSVLLSVLLFPPTFLQRPVILTAWAAVAVCSLVEKITGKDARIKWPNDVLVQGWKISGILIEQKQGVVVGIGVNVQQDTDDLIRSALPGATSLRMHTNTVPTTHEVARLLLGELDKEYQNLLEGNLGSLEARWVYHLGLLNQEVEVECQEENHQGRLMGLSFASLDLQGTAGAFSVVPERVKHVMPVSQELRPFLPEC